MPTYRTITSFDWDGAPLPRHRQRAGILHADAYCMPRTSRDKAAAWAFIEFANSPDGQRTIAASGRTVPSLRTVAESPAFLDPGARPRNGEVFLREIPYIHAVPVTPAWVDVEELAGEELTRAYYGRGPHGLQTGLGGALVLAFGAVGSALIDRRAVVLLTAAGLVFALVVTAVPALRHSDAEAHGDGPDPVHGPGGGDGEVG